jgi:hypothetical protein
MSGPFTRSGLFCRAQPLPAWRMCLFLVDPTGKASQPLVFEYEMSKSTQRCIYTAFLLEKAYFSTFAARPRLAAEMAYKSGVAGIWRAENDGPDTPLWK